MGRACTNNMWSMILCNPALSNRQSLTKRMTVDSCWSSCGEKNAGTGEAPVKKLGPSKAKTNPPNRLGKLLRPEPTSQKLLAKHCQTFETSTDWLHWHCKNGFISKQLPMVVRLDKPPSSRNSYCFKLDPGVSTPFQKHLTVSTSLASPPLSSSRNCWKCNRLYQWLFNVDDFAIAKVPLVFSQDVENILPRLCRVCNLMDTKHSYTACDLLLQLTRPHHSRIGLASNKSLALKTSTCILKSGLQMRTKKA